jgi:hypothetical protein
MYLLIYSSSNQWIAALVCGGTAAPGRSARPADGSQRAAIGTTSPGVPAAGMRLPPLS